MHSPFLPLSPCRTHVCRNYKGPLSPVRKVLHSQCLVRFGLSGSSKDQNEAAVSADVSVHAVTAAVSCDNATLDLRKRAGLQESKRLRTAPAAIGGSFTLSMLPLGVGWGGCTVHLHTMPPSWTPFGAPPRSMFPGSSVTTGLRVDD